MSIRPETTLQIIASLSESHRQSFSIGFCSTLELFQGIVVKMAIGERSRWTECLANLDYYRLV
jgi:hypothetical protein